MKPPICHLCGKSDDPTIALVQFADYAPLPPGRVGHPLGCEWFCGEHSAKAKQLRHLPLAEAMRKMKPGWFRF